MRLQRFRYLAAAIAVACGFWGGQWFAFRARGQELGARNAGQGTELLVFPTAAPGGGQYFVVVDPASRAMCSYHVDGQKGGITLKSVRNISWDLYLEEFNGTAPSPRDIKALLERK
ncbi:MAG TPA: hypothetical protein VIY86_08545 [Pirellulaceae bacterium]